MDPNDPLSSALGLVHHRLIVSMLGGNIGRLERDRDRDGIYTIPYYPNTLTCKSAATKNALRDPLHGPIAWNTSPIRPTICYIYLYVYNIGIYADVMISAIIMPLRQYPVH